MAFLHTDIPAVPMLTEDTFYSEAVDALKSCTAAFVISASGGGSGDVITVTVQTSNEVPKNGLYINQTFNPAESSWFGFTVAGSPIAGDVDATGASGPLALAVPSDVALYRWLRLKTVYKTLNGDPTATINANVLLRAFGSQG